MIKLYPFFYLFLLVNSLKKQIKFCVDCKYFIAPNDGTQQVYGICSKFPIGSPKFLVDGVFRNDDFFTCSTARKFDDMCGKNATKFVRKYKTRASKQEELED